MNEAGGAASPSAREVLKAAAIAALAPPVLFSLLFGAALTLFGAGDVAARWAVLVAILLLPVSYVYAAIAVALFLIFIRYEELTIWHVFVTSLLLGIAAGSTGAWLGEGWASEQASGSLLGVVGGLLFGAVFWRLLPRKHGAGSDGRRQR